ncbi:MAG: hypothetical protein R2748_19600 [Bryobacterales bacterium]
MFFIPRMTRVRISSSRGVSREVERRLMNPTNWFEIEALDPDVALGDGAQAVQDDAERQGLLEDPPSADLQGAERLDFRDLGSPQNRFGVEIPSLDLGNDLKDRLRPERLVQQTHLGRLALDQFKRLGRRRHRSHKMQIIGFIEAATQTLDDHRLRLACANSNHP